MFQEDLRQRAAAVDIPQDVGTIYPFYKTDKSLLRTLTRELNVVTNEKEAKKVFVLLTINVVCTVILLIWGASTNSMALLAYNYLTIFDIFSLLTCLVTIWVRKQKPSRTFSFGYARFEVLAVFSSTILAILGSLFIVKEGVERLVEEPEIHNGRLLIGACLAFVVHMMISYSNENKAFNHVMRASASSWLQEHVSDISESVCRVIPGLSKLLLPRINPFALIGCAGFFALVIVYMLIDMQNYYAADTWAAVWIALMTMGTMFPMSVYTGKILLQTTPSHIIAQLDKSIREASTLDGVLEFRYEHFWTLDFSTMTGSVHVRIRRDADEQMVLAHVYNRMSNLISILSVQVFKDDWTRPTTFQILGDPSLFPKMAPGTMSPPNMNSPRTASPYSSNFTTLDRNIGSNILNNSTYTLPNVKGLSSPPGITNNYVRPANLNTEILKLLGSTTAPAYPPISTGSDYRYKNIASGAQHSTYGATSLQSPQMNGSYTESSSKEK